MSSSTATTSSRKKRNSDAMAKETQEIGSLGNSTGDGDASTSTSARVEGDLDVGSSGGGGDGGDGGSSRKRQATTTNNNNNHSSRIDNTTTTTTTNQPQTGLSSEPDTHASAPSPSEEDYGAHYKVLLQALEVAVRKGANRWTAKDLKASYPHLSAGEVRMRSFDEVWERSAREMREKMMSQAELIIHHYQVAPALKRLHTALEEARERKRVIASGAGLGDVQGEAEAEGEGGRGVSISDVWRPNLSPEALTAAYNLPRYDAVYTRLREEYVQLYKDCDRLASEVEGKKRRMDEIKDQVVRANKQLESTAIKLQDVPNEEIKTWMEDVAGNDRGMRTLAG